MEEYGSDETPHSAVVNVGCGLGAHTVEGWRVGTAHLVTGGEGAAVLGAADDEFGDEDDEVDEGDDGGEVAPADTWTALLAQCGIGARDGIGRAEEGNALSCGLTVRKWQETEIGWESQQSVDVGTVQCCAVQSAVVAVCEAHFSEADLV